MIETINKRARTSRQFLHKQGSEPAPEEMTERLSMSSETGRKVMVEALESQPQDAQLLDQLSLAGGEFRPTAADF